jgi:GT2 family glycosyltransferase
MIYGMITTAKSSEYTTIALDSFFANTKLFENNDQFVLIDNDYYSYTKVTHNVTIIRNKRPLSFAENVNQLIQLAVKSKTSLFFLSNDIYFPKNWDKYLSLHDNDNYITVPSCNQTHIYEHNGWISQSTCTYKDFVPDTVDQIAEYHIEHNKHNGVYTDRLIPLYCMHIPLKILQNVGEFDINYGKAGAEDVDYRIRALISGYKTIYQTSSWLLHFHGKSTWEKETEKEIQDRNKIYTQYFVRKWGKAMCDLCLNTGDLQYLLTQHQDLLILAQVDKWDEIILQLLNDRVSNRILRHRLAKDL